MGNQEFKIKIKFAHIEPVRDATYLSTNIKWVGGFSDQQLRKELSVKDLHFRCVLPKPP